MVTYKNIKVKYPYIRKRNKKSIQILLYHRVNDQRDYFFQATPIPVFKKHLELLNSQFNILSLEEAIKRIKEKDIPNNAVVVTFDDGYSDNYINAFPLLKRYRIPATIFLTTDAINSNRVIWHDRVFSAFRETNVISFKGFTKELKELKLKTLKEKLFAQQKVLNILQSVKNVERNLLIEKLLMILEVEDKKVECELMLNWNEVKEMSKAGISFGSHTVTHPILTMLKEDEMKIELYKSKEIIEKNLGKKVISFAYPNGREKDFNMNVKKILRECGYECAVTTIFGTNDYDQDTLELRRFTPWEEEIEKFAMKLAYYKFCY